MAIDAYKIEQKKANGLHRGLSKIASLYNVNHNTLYNQLHGKQSIIEHNSKKQKLGVEEEATLVNLVLKCLDWGIPLLHKEIIQYTNHILQRIHPAKDVEVGDS